MGDGIRTVSIDIRGEPLCLPEDLYERLLSWATPTSMSFTEYIESVLLTTEVPNCWVDLPERAVRLLKVYIFLLSDCERSVQAMKNLYQD